MYEARQNKEKVSRRIGKLDRKGKIQYSKDIRTTKNVVQMVRWVWNGSNWISQTRTNQRPPNFQGYEIGAVCITDDDIDNTLTDQQLASRITSVDDNSNSIGPFDGERGNIACSRGPVFFDENKKWAIGRDYSDHAGGDTWKLFHEVKNCWMRIDTLYGNGKRMFRG